MWRWAIGRHCKGVPGDQGICITDHQQEHEEPKIYQWAEGWIGPEGRRPAADSPFGGANVSAESVHRFNWLLVIEIERRALKEIQKIPYPDDDKEGPGHAVSKSQTHHANGKLKIEPDYASAVCLGLHEDRSFQDGGDKCRRNVAGHVGLQKNKMGISIFHQLRRLIIGDAENHHDRRPRHPWAGLLQPDSGQQQ